MNSETREETRRRNLLERRRFIKQWAAYVRSHDDEQWAEQQHKLLDSQRESAQQLAEQVGSVHRRTGRDDAD